MAKKTRKALGRGLGALLEDSNTDQKSSSKENKDFTDISTGASINEIPLDAIEVNPFQPRTDFDKQALEELSESIKVQGIIQPITVRKLSKDSYQLISGERRTQASKLAGLKSIPAYIRTADDQQMLEMALIENIQRENLNSIEIALSYQRLLTECDLKQEQLGDRVGKNRTTVNNYLRLLKLPPDIQLAIRDKRISMGHARAIINIEDVDKQLDVFKKILKDDLSVRKVEALVRELTSGEGKEKDKTSKVEMPYEAKQVQTKLSSHFGTKVGMKIDKNNKGEIKIPFLSKDDLNRILDILSVEL
ncbi:ParB/RepB/Spo0J family partition protein [Marivirga harenae]|uniref:ParB/RepB/Spo0J family partition protein n=1 Tax=Marivirga harenae TaxID=2010992 RepID=UPI0026DEDEC2|nr:ParB/RepB/Spo0J family partition protein [Marivirga harenae]WKV10924.1 ParB/RepB/Spo0J family partition protein [Marivirga harenae]|tara:strand:- start:211128 stop:212042 length:915 start_codon:yes stop_codon:yes gene_type:complete